MEKTLMIGSKALFPFATSELLLCAVESVVTHLAPSGKNILEMHLKYLIRQPIFYLIVLKLF